MSRILRKFFLPIIFPSALVSITQQSLLVVLPLYVLAIGGSWTESAMIIGIKGMGMMLADLPASLLIARFGDKKVMLCAAFVSVCAILILALFPTLAMVSAAALLLEDTVFWFCRIFCPSFRLARPALLIICGSLGPG